MVLIFFLWYLPISLIPFRKLSRRAEVLADYRLVDEIFSNNDIQNLDLITKEILDRYSAKKRRGTYIQKDSLLFSAICLSAIKVYFLACVALYLFSDLAIADYANEIFICGLLYSLAGIYPIHVALGKAYPIYECNYKLTKLLIPLNAHQLIQIETIVDTLPDANLVVDSILKSRELVFLDLLTLLNARHEYMLSKTKNCN